MTRPNAVTVVTVLALLLGASASLFAYNYLKKQGVKQYQGVPVVSAAVDLAIGTKLDPSNVKVAKWPKEALPRDYCTDPNALVGRVMVRPVSAGDVITQAKLMPINTSGGIMTYMVPQGHRAVTVSVNEVAGVAGFISPSSRVDVVLTTPTPGSTDDKDSISKIMLQNVPVLATGQVTEQREGKPAVVPTVTLDLVPDDAEKLIVGAKKGTLQLLLRNMVDVASVDTRGATVAKALGVTGLQRPVVVTRTVAAPRQPAVHRAVASAPVQARFTMEVIKGGAKSTRDFPE
ncbi:Flp pilus assembly protein CpaB [Geomonas sp. RF6]|uniref:Flp pilus assembly protein CpaB n=1 Tax=Geomonas sp. RF6 TaxID=2897342 RepID=UPI001E4F9C4B|nr:Flp pilus assembly protein CpaB [Geomonas sp. RF6]UFS70013.1 Flp pilus assembly protein CpaB [Geomonas sp. RF6]